MKAIPLLLLFLPLLNGQKVRDMFYRSTEKHRISIVYPNNCAFPCRALGDDYQSLEIGSVNRPCPNPVPWDYDLTNDLSSGIMAQKPCDPSEVILLFLNASRSKLAFLSV